MIEIVFLSTLALIWIIFAVIQDLRTREIANWLNFSLIIFALGFRFFYSLFTQNGFGFFYQGLMGLGIFFILGNAFYYGKLFAGGDAKLMIALGAVLPFTNTFPLNLTIALFFLLIFFLVGAVYTILTSLFIGLKNSKSLKKEFRIQFSKNKLKIKLAILFAIIFGVLGILTIAAIFYFAILIFILPYIYIYAKAVDESCMIKLVSSNDLREGDWLYKDVCVGHKTIKANWDGLSKKDIDLLSKTKNKIQIREGMPFSPVFLISFVLLLVFYKWLLVWNFFI